MPRLLFMVLLPLLCGAALSAELPAAIPPVPADGLDVDEAVATALKWNPDLRALRKQSAIAEGEIVTAGALHNPSLKIELLHAQEASQMGWSGTLSFIPPQPVELSARRGQASARLDEVRSAIAEREWGLINQVRLSHATLIELREQKRLYEESVAVRQRLISIIRTRVERGATTRLELNLAEIAGLQMRRALDELELRRVQGQAQLQGLMGLVSAEPIQVRGERASDVDLAAEPDAAALFASALGQRPLLKAAHARIRQREQALRLEKTRRWPWFELNTSYRHNNSTKYPNDLQLGVELNLPVLNLNSGPIQVAHAELDREQAQLEAQVISVEQSIRAACAELRVRREILVRFQREVLPIISEHERLMEVAVRGLQVDLVALLGSEESALRARREESDARLAYQRAWLALESAAGAPLREVVR